MLGSNAGAGGITTGSPLQTIQTDVSAHYFWLFVVILVILSCFVDSRRRRDANHSLPVLGSRFSFYRWRRKGSPYNPVGISSIFYRVVAQYRFAQRSCRCCWTRPSRHRHDRVRQKSLRSTPRWRHRYPQLRAAAQDSDADASFAIVIYRR